MKIRILMSMMVMLTITASTAFAQNNFQGKRPQGPPPEVVKYLQDNVFPVLKIQRNQLDKELSANEKSRITEIRAELKSLHKTRLEKRNEMFADGERPTVEQRQEMREMRTKMSKLMDEAEIIADNHDATILRLFGEISDDFEEWKSDLDDLCVKDCPQGLNCPNSCQGRQGQRMCNGTGKRQGFGNCGGKGGPPNFGRGFGPGMGPENEMPLHRLLSPEGFLLWNPEEPMPFENSAELVTNKLEVNIFPNPAAQQVQISLKLIADSKINISIIDKQGNEIQQFKTEQANKGLYTKALDVSKLKDGLYFIKIKAGEESALERLVVKN